MAMRVGIVREAVLGAGGIVEGAQEGLYILPAESRL